MQITETSKMSVIKRNGELVPFNPEKIKNAILKAVKATNQKIEDAILNNILADITEEVTERFKNIFPNVENIQDLVEKHLVKNQLYEISKAYILYRAERQKARELEKAQTIEKAKTGHLYVTKKNGTKVLFDLRHIRSRLAQVTKGYEGLIEDKKEEKAIEFYNVMSRMLYVPSTPTLFHSGLTRSQLSSCYLTTIEDDLAHIFKCIGDNAQLSKWSGGLGNDWTNLRATGSLIKTIKVESQGIIPFLKIANDTTAAINRSGKRRGATCAYLETWHLDIEDFLDLRRNTGDERRRVHDMNTSNWIPDLFMKRVLEGADWTLFSPDETPDLHHLYGKKFDSKYIEYEEKAKQGLIKKFKVMPAQQLWKRMLTRLFETGHPWITFKDPCNIRSPQDHVGVIHSSNLCTEITLNTSADETAVCNLGSINFEKHVTEKGIDEALLASTVRTAIRMLDNVIDINFYPTIEAENSNKKHRPIGLGIMGVQDALFRLNLPFDAEEAFEFSDRIMELISYHAIAASSNLAKEKGSYESFKGSKWDRGIFPLDTLDILEQERGMEIPISRKSTLDWASLKKKVRMQGMRNSNTMAVAHTATISTIAGCYPCIEPMYKNIYVKSNMSGEFTIINSYLIDDLRKMGLWNDEMLEQLKYYDGNISMIAAIPY